MREDTQEMREEHTESEGDNVKMCGEDRDGGRVKERMRR